MKTAKVVSILAAVSFLSMHAAHAQTIQFNDDLSAATGITGLTVSGTTYDVDFTGRFTHLEWASMLDVTTLAEADAIAETIGILLDDAGVTLIEFDLASGGVFAHDSVSLWYDTNATSLLGVAIGAPGGWGTFVGSSNAPLNNSRPFAIDLIVSTAIIDTDEDGVEDAQDNCLLTANSDQLDSNADGFGNACDADLTDDCTVNFLDLGVLKSVFFMNDADADFNGDGVVNFIDLGTMKASFFQPPGPSGVPNVCDGG